MVDAVYPNWWTTSSLRCVSLTLTLTLLFGVFQSLEMVMTRLLVANSLGMPKRSRLRASECQATNVIIVGKRNGGEAYRL